MQARDTGGSKHLDRILNGVDGPDQTSLVPPDFLASLWNEHKGLGRLDVFSTDC